MVTKLSVHETMNKNYSRLLSFQHLVLLLVNDNQHTKIFKKETLCGSRHTFLAKPFISVFKNFFLIKQISIAFYKYFISFSLVKCSKFSKPLIAVQQLSKKKLLRDRKAHLEKLGDFFIKFVNL